ncbi:hypothetical protein [Cohnella silvisoli]|uniref:DUF4432 family protein n=1 Tax=Cohnella silvisoli TaxID=2873699 RepID=A0ABV1KMW1_9BACL|nr:hypothetical protein [Cohnella silvisoli]MCD9020302.1 hypothetical protein [Cohnella silvisoli]
MTGKDREKQIYYNMEKSTYRGLDCWVMETAAISLIVVPELGGNIVSLQYKPTAKEWLTESKSDEMRGSLGYGETYSEQAMFGWDECFPTIVACPYPAEGAYEGRIIPDHGELWSMPWDVYSENGVLICKAAGRALPYEITRRMSFADERVVRFEYEVVNTGEEAISVFWTAHPLFAATEHTQICVPDGLKQMLCTDGGRNLDKGRVYDWPETIESPYPRLDFIRPAGTGDSRKFYAEGPVDSGWAGLYERNSGEFVVLEWSPEELPYFGFWINEGEFNGQLVCALEPCNGFYDTLSTAYENGKLLQIPAMRGKAHWSLQLRLGCGSLQKMR